MANYNLLRYVLLLAAGCMVVRAEESVVTTTLDSVQVDATTLAAVPVAEEETTLQPTVEPSSDGVQPSSSTATATTARNTTVVAGENGTTEQQHSSVQEDHLTQTITITTAARGHETNNHIESDHSTSSNSELQEQQHQQHRVQQLLHLCSSASSCGDPNSHCVGTDEGNRCVCFLGFFLNETSGVCQREPETTTTTTTSTTTTTTTTEATTNVVSVEIMSADKRSDEHEHESITTISEQPQTATSEAPHLKRKYAMQASSLSTEQNQAVVSMILRPYTTVVEWLMENDLKFRTGVADIIGSTNFTVHGENGTSVVIAPDITADDIIYVSPSPQIFSDGLLVSFVVQDRSGISSKENLRKKGLVIRSRRNPEERVPLNEQSPSHHSEFFPAQWIIPAVCANQTLLEILLGQNVSTIYAGLSSDLLSIERLASASLFERRIDVFVPVIILLGIVCLACILSVVCVRAKARSSATWDPPAGLVYTKPRRDQTNPGARRESGQDLASDIQCREGETDSISKHVIPISDDDVWVVPYTEPQQGAKPQIWTEVQDTKL